MLARWTVSLLLVAHSGLSLAADVPPTDLQEEAKHLQESADQVELRLSQASTTRLSEPVGQRQKTDDIAGLLQLARKYAHDQCTLIQDVYEANGKQLDPLEFEDCEVALRLQTTGFIAAYGELAMDSRVFGVTTQDFCAGAVGAPDACPEPAAIRELRESENQKDENLRDGIRRRVGVFGVGTAPQLLKLSNDFNRADTEFEAFVDRGCRLASTLRVHPAPPWIKNQCEAAEREFAMYTLICFLSFMKSR